MAYDHIILKGYSTNSYIDYSCPVGGANGYAMLYVKEGTTVPTAQSKGTHVAKVAVPWSGKTVCIFTNSQKCYSYYAEFYTPNVVFTANTILYSSSTTTSETANRYCTINFILNSTPDFTNFLVKESAVRSIFTGSNYMAQYSGFRNYITHGNLLYRFNYRYYNSSKEQKYLSNNDNRNPYSAIYLRQGDDNCPHMCQFKGEDFNTNYYTGQLITGRENGRLLSCYQKSDDYNVSTDSSVTLSFSVTHTSYTGITDGQALFVIENNGAVLTYREQMFVPNSGGELFLLNGKKIYYNQIGTASNNKLYVYLRSKKNGTYTPWVKIYSGDPLTMHKNVSITPLYEALTQYYRKFYINFDAEILYNCFKGYIDDLEENGEFFAISYRVVNYEQLMSYGHSFSTLLPANTFEMTDYSDIDYIKEIGDMLLAPTIDSIGDTIDFEIVLFDGRLTYRDSVTINSSTDNYVWLDFSDSPVFRKEMYFIYVNTQEYGFGTSYNYQIRSNITEEVLYTFTINVTLPPAAPVQQYYELQIMANNYYRDVDLYVKPLGETSYSFVKSFRLDEDAIHIDQT